MRQGLEEDAFAGGEDSVRFALNPSLDRNVLRAEFKRAGRLEIRDFLADEGAQQLRDHLLRRDDWVTVLNAGEKVYELPVKRVGEMKGSQRARLDRLVDAAARDGFQYRFETIRVPDGQADRTDAILDRFVAFLSSEEVIAFFRELTGASDIAFADGQATSYSPGSFLTRHDDGVEGKNRRCAYVLGLTRGWRAEWGGLLMFHRPDGNIEEAFIPAMGALRLFRVPVPHSVSYVAPFAREPRLSVTGWLRAIDC